MTASERVCGEIRGADLICFPMGSFYSSVIANLLPGGIGAAIAQAVCPKIYVPNLGQDPEELGLCVADRVERLVDAVRRDAGDGTPVARILNAALVDCSADAYALPPELDRVRSIGVEVVDLRLVSDSSHPWIDPNLLSAYLVSLT